MKPRYEVLDGLRGVAALAVVGVHILNTFFPDVRTNPLRHAGLAVDFFYMLSGFVVAHAYDARLPMLGARRFFALRLTRLHPLVLLGATLGLASYVLDPFYAVQHHVAWPRLALVYGLALLLIPAPDLPNRSGATHALNGPSWSLTQEYLANVAFALIGPRLGRNSLIALVAVAGLALIPIGLAYDGLQVGWTWDTLWLAPIRTAFPFFAGVLMQRAAVRLPVRGAWMALPLVLMAVFAGPYLPHALNGAFELAAVLIVFPLVIAAGAAADAKGLASRACRLAGELSYPIYIVHYPLVQLFSDWVWTRHPSHAAILAAGAALLVGVVALAWAALKLYDEPVRAWLAGRGRAPPQTLAGVGPDAAPAG